MQIPNTFNFQGKIPNSTKTLSVSLPDAVLVNTFDNI